MLRTPDPVIYFTAVMYNPDFIDNADEIVENIFGGIILKSGEFSFDHTTYYEPEMGSGLIKYFAAFGGLQVPDLLPVYKRNAINAEISMAKDTKRVINIDPAYLAMEKIVVASTKNFTHRIYLGEGIFGDLQLMRKKDGYKSFDWTYADYLRPEAVDFFDRLMRILKKLRFAETSSG